MISLPSNPELWLAALFGTAMLLSVSLAQAASFRGDDGPLNGWTRLPVTEDSIVITAPQGYCIDPLATLSANQGAFVLMASCRSVTGDVLADSPEVSGLLTTNVDGRYGRFPSHGELSSFFVSDTGRAALSRSGNPDSMRLGAMFSREGVLYLKADENGTDPAFGGASWRAIFELNGHMVTTTLRDLANQPFGDGEGFRILKQHVESLFEANPDSTKSRTEAFSAH